MRLVSFRVLGLLILCVTGVGADAWDGATGFRVATTPQAGDSAQESRWAAPEIPAPAVAFVDRLSPRPDAGHVARPGVALHPAAPVAPRRESRSALARALLPDLAPSV